MNQQLPENVLFEFTHNGDRWECRPSGLWGSLGFAFFLAGGAFCLCFGGSIFWNIADSFYGIGFGAVPLLAAGLQVWTASH